jgi:hypothetical protein
MLKQTTMTLRQERVIHALVQTKEWISREAIDRIAGASQRPRSYPPVALPLWL